MIKEAARLDRLSAAQRDQLLQRLLAARRTSRPRGEPSPPPELRPRRELRVFPLSLLQRRLWTVQMLQPESAAYNFFVAARLDGPIAVPALDRALNEILRRYDVLRTGFRIDGAQPVQFVTEWRHCPLAVIDLSSAAEDRRETIGTEIVRDHAAEPFDLGCPLLWRTLLVRLDDRAHLLFIGTHHLLCDGWSSGQLMREVGVLYEAFLDGRPSPLPEPSVQYGDFSMWQREAMSTQALDRQRAYWRARLDGVVPFELPADPPARCDAGEDGATRQRRAPAPLADRLIAIGSAEHATPFVVWQAAFTAFAYSCTGASDVSIGMPVSVRDRPETETLVGFLVNTLVIRTRPARDWTYRRFLREVRDAVADALQHRDLPFEDVVDMLRRERVCAPPLVRILFMQNAPSLPHGLRRVAVTPVELDNQTAKFDLNVNIGALEDGVRIAWNYKPARFASATIDRWMDAFVEHATALADRPDDLVCPRDSDEAITRPRSVGEAYA